jgi:hypothetical protein
LNLLTTKNLVDPVKVRIWLGSICPSCRMRLSGCVEWRQVEADDFQYLEALLLVKPSYPSTRFPVSFRRASELQAEPHLYFGDENLDQFLKGLGIGQSIFLYGSWQCLAASELLCIRAQLEARHGGLDSKAIFIDGGNTFDPYLIAHYAERLSLDRDKALNRVLVSRAFTCHQLTSLVTQMLPEATHKRGAKLIVASNLIEPYRESDTYQSLNLLKATLNSLSTITRLERAIALITSLNEKTFDSDPFLRAVKQRVDIVLRFEERRHSTKLILEKHPTRPEESATIKQPTPRFLEEFLEASTSG